MLEKPAPSTNVAEAEPGVVVSMAPGSAARAHEFNEQTNYVPRRTIITVSRFKPQHDILCVGRLIVTSR